MEMKFKTNNIEQIKQMLSILKGELKGNQPETDLIVAIQKGSGQVYEEVNEIYRALTQVENALYDLIETTETVIGNSNEIIKNTDTGIGNAFNKGNETSLLDALRVKDFSVK